ncbi:MAG: hypothetical protein KZQ70_13945, partial [gamma proteobacterium symbiont of Lucinoma myriamae]|nr:hypothetical protein [gamma proteobacterium symbiont of Lucinoma myriamae]
QGIQGPQGEPGTGITGDLIYTVPVGPIAECSDLNDVALSGSIQCPGVGVEGYEVNNNPGALDNVTGTCIGGAPALISVNCLRVGVLP